MNNLSEEKKSILIKIKTEINTMIETAKESAKFYQEEANSHQGAMESRYDTFKEEAQYMVSGQQRRVNELTEYLVNINLLISR